MSKDPIKELKKLPQWVCSRIVMRDGKPTKPPFTVDGAPASVTDPKTWATYEECKNSGAPFVGFVLTKEDPYCFIDLDPPETDEQLLRHKAIIQKFDSYTEFSQSGKGYHIITRGEVPKGFRRDKVEVYSSERFMITTEHVHRAAPIRERQDLLDILHREMARTGIVRELIDGEEVATDGELLEMAHRAQNGAKFARLFKGDQTGYPSQSEADFALLSLLCFYSRNTDQVMRIFRSSELGKRKKAQRDDYLLRAIQNIRSAEPPPVDISNLKMDTEDPPETEAAPAECVFPPGLVGELALYIYQSAVRPVPEVGLAGALALAAGIFGRAYNVSNTGLNQYIILLAKTGAGKDGALSGIERLLTAIRKRIPSIDRKIGPAGFASGQAVLRALDKEQCFLSVLGEFGLTLQQICDTRASASQLMLRKVLLDVYSRSGYGNFLRPHAYADASNNTATIAAPAVSILGEATPESFFQGITEAHVAEGLIPRFTVIEYMGDRPASNHNKFYAPDAGMIDRLVNATTGAIEAEHSGQVKNVMVSLTALDILDNFDTFADSVINSTEADIAAQLWNRAHLKALKAAALVAVGVNHRDPEITEEIAAWAVQFVKSEIGAFLLRFEREKLDGSGAMQERDLLEAFVGYSRIDASKRRGYKVPKRLVHEKAIVPFSFLRRRLARLKSFKDDRRGADFALDVVLKHLITERVLQELPADQASTLGTRQRLFVRGEMF